MNLVWPLTVIYSGPLGVWAYFAIGRQRAHEHHQHSNGHGMSAPHRPFWQTVAIGTMHCGSGCTVGDVVAEWLAFFFPTALVWFGYGTLWGHRTYSVWMVDYVAALLFGIIFQYFAVVPMRHLSPGQGLWTAFKVDVLSLTAWQVGMYGGMAIALFGIFGPDSLPVTNPAFWFVMQLAMLVGFSTSYPVNWWLLRAGIKEQM